MARSPSSIAALVGAGVIPASGGIPISPPANIVLPSVSGASTSGQTLTANDGTWTGSPVLTRQWKADGVAIPGQTSATLPLDASLVGKLITVTVTGTNAGGSASATSAAVGPVAAAGPQAVVMPTPSFGSANLLAWWDVTKTWKDSSGVDQPSVTYDTVGFDTVSSMEDLTGNGYGIQQGEKSLQPIKGAAGGPVFDAAGHTLEIFRKALINGKSGLTFFAKLRPRGDLYAGGAARCILAISRASSTTLIRQTFELSSGSTGRRMFANINIADSSNAADSRATTSTTAPQLTDNAWNSCIWVENFSASPVVADFFNNSLTSGYTDTGLVPATGSPPFAYGASDARLIQFGDTLATGRPAYAEMLAAGIIEGPVDSTRLAAIKTYLDGLA